MSFSLSTKNQSQLEFLLAEKQSQRKFGKIRPKRGVRQMFPGNIERQYTRDLSRYVAAMIEITQNRIFPAISGIINSANFFRPTNDSLISKLINWVFPSKRIDDFGDDIDNLINQSEDEFSAIYPDSRLKIMSAEIAANIAIFNRKELTKVFKQMIGIDVFFNEPWLAQEMNAFVTENVSLIKTIESRYFPKIEQIIYQGAKQGIRAEEIRKQITEEFGKTRNIAKRIARDQVNKFNGQLTMLRQTNLGVKRYKWRNVGDRRVRGNPSGLYPTAIPSHWARDGKIYSWNKPPEGGHPGQPIQCRCYAEPLLEDLLPKTEEGK